MAAALYLVSPPLSEAGTFAAQLEQACAVKGVKALLLQLAAADEKEQIACVKELAPLAQKHGVAVLVDTSARVALYGGADGFHTRDVKASLQIKPKYSLGAGGITSRDAAMQAGEDGADYVMFGEPENGALPDLDTVIALTEWWAELFQIPCVAYAPSSQAVAALLRAKPDFIALGDWIWQGDVAQNLHLVVEAIANRQ
jgi:thiamine-phosphate pyrophosphorylase